jgi:uncharacterized protein YggT (Ycf19 family)
MDSSISPTTKPLLRGVQIVRYLFGLLEVLLALRFILKLAGANPGAEFSNFIYMVTYPFAQPFLAVFRVTIVAGKVFEWTTLLALVIYMLIEWGIIRLLLMGKDVSTPEAASKLEQEDS